MAVRIIISPAKKMREDSDSLAWRNLPAHLEQTQQLCQVLQGMSYDQLKKLWKCNDQIAQLNVERLQTMDLHRGLTPAILSYEGIQYRYMAPGVFTQEELEYVEEHLRILSGFYGLVRPFDGVMPYRLEMQAKLPVGQAKDLYAFWGDSLARDLWGETDCVINLASKEYSVCISRYVPPNARLITCVFGEEQGGKVVEKGTMCKMARGEMVRWMAQNRVERPEQLREFTGQGFCFSARHAGADRLVFVRRGG